MERLIIEQLVEVVAAGAFGGAEVEQMLLRSKKAAVSTMFPERRIREPLTIW